MKIMCTVLQYDFATFKYSTVSKKRGSGPKICDHTQRFIDDFQGTALDYYLVNKSEIYETLEMKGFQ